MTPLVSFPTPKLPGDHLQCSSEGNGRKPYIGKLGIDIGRIKNTMPCSFLRSSRTFAIELARKTLGMIQRLRQYAGRSGLIVSIHRAKDAVASIIKRLAHRNANVQLYTLEVRIPHPGAGLEALTTMISWQMPCLRTAVIRCIGSYRQEVSRMPCCDWQMIAYVENGQ